MVCANTVPLTVLWKQPLGKAEWKATEFTADFDKVGVVKEWNATDGTLQPINATIVNNRTRLTIKLEAWESKLISIGKNNREYNIKEYGVKGNGYSENSHLP